MNENEISRDELLRMFAHVKSLDSNDYHAGRELLKELTAGRAQEVTKAWAGWNETKNNNPDWFPLDLTNPDNWRTYQKCVDVSYRLLSDRIEADVIIYDGDNFSGERERRRWTATLSLPLDFVTSTYLQRAIRYEFSELLEREYYRYEQEKKARWMMRRAKRLLSK